MKLISWNVNGIRAAERGGFVKWFEDEKADIVCVQEIKATPAQVSPEMLNPLNYHSYWHPAQKAGYSGVAIYSKKEPLQVGLGLGVAGIDAEGRVLVADYGDFVLLNCYFPNSQRDHARLGYKLAFCAEMLRYCETLRKQGKHVVICGDFNIAHREIDLRNPKENVANAGFLPEERAWMDQWVQAGYVDTFRKHTADPGHYTWWSYRPGVRDRNIGWRLDYYFVNEELSDRLSRTEHQPHIKGSDHCPVVMKLRT